MRRPQYPLNAAFRNPTVIGALTVLITILAVFLAYNANNGLPFVKTYRLTAEVPNADGLVQGNEVRIGGVRVGIVEDIEPIAKEDGTHGRRAVAEARHGASTRCRSTRRVIIRSRSALGLQYVELVRGESDEGYAAGATIPVSQARPEPVEVDELLSTFDEPTRMAIQQNLLEFGNALAGRGPALNEAIGALRAAAAAARARDAHPRRARHRHRPVLRRARAVGRRRSRRSPRPRRRCSSSSNTTLQAFADVARPYLQDTISQTPGDPARRRPRRCRRSARSWSTRAACSRDLEPGSAALARLRRRRSRSALRAGIPVLRDSPDPQRRSSRPTRGLAARLQRRPGRPHRASAGSTDLSDALRPPLRFIGPAQSRLQLRDAAVPQPRPARAARATASATGSAATRSNTPLGPNNEGGPLERAGQRRRRRRPRATSCTPTPTRTRPRRVRRSSARPATRPTSTGQVSIGNVARQPGDLHRGPDPLQNPDLPRPSDEEETG